MHLHDLFEDDIDFTIRPIKTTKDPYSLASSEFIRHGPDYEPIQDKPGLEKLGAGVVAFAVAKKDKPHDVKRITFRASSYAKDPYLTFLRTAIKNQDNPHFPRIYMVKIFQRPGEKKNYHYPYIYYVETERLQEWNKLNWAQISYLFNRYLGKSVRQASKERISQSGTHIADKMDAMAMFTDKLGLALYKREGGPTVGITTDDSMTQALESLRQAMIQVDSSGVTVYPDVHKGNIMYRFTPTGVTPVITDPFHGYPES